MEIGLVAAWLLVWLLIGSVVVAIVVYTLRSQPMILLRLASLCLPWRKRGLSPVASAEEWWALPLHDRLMLEYQLPDRDLEALLRILASAPAPGPATKPNASSSASPAGTGATPATLTMPEDSRSLLKYIEAALRRWPVGR